MFICPYNGVCFVCALCGPGACVKLKFPFPIGRSTSYLKNNIRDPNHRLPHHHITGNEKLIHNAPICGGKRTADGDSSLAAVLLTSAVTHHGLNYPRQPTFSARRDRKANIHLLNNLLCAKGRGFCMPCGQHTLSKVSGCCASCTCPPASSQTCSAID
jgi:hypothetical protein